MPRRTKRVVRPRNQDFSKPVARLNRDVRDVRVGRGEVRTISPKTWRIIIAAVIIITILFLLRPKPPVIPGENLSSSGTSEPIDLRGKGAIQLPPSGVISPNSFGALKNQNLTPQQ